MTDMTFKLFLAGTVFSYLAVLASGEPCAILDSKYEAQSAEKKQSSVWSLLTQSQSPASFPKSRDRETFFSRDNTNMGLVFDHCSDLRPWPKQETKFIHPTGTVAKVKFESDGKHPFTGMFKGTDFGLVRLSVFASRRDNKLTPSIALKFFRDGLASANLLTMLWFDAQESKSFFAHEFNNHGEVFNGLPLNEVHEKFVPVDEWWRMTGLSDIASTDQRGNKESPVFPYEVRLVPHGDLTEQLKNIEVDAEDQASVLETIKDGTILYFVYGRESPDGCSWHTVGTITTTSEMISSEYGDLQLFFRHQRMAEDIALNPQWEKHMRKERRLQSETNDKNKYDRGLYNNEGLYNKGNNRGQSYNGGSKYVGTNEGGSKYAVFDQYFTPPYEGYEAKVQDISDDENAKYELGTNTNREQTSFDVDGCPFAISG